ncbi:hypothetical protein N8975_01375 [Candidatus Pelagibacter ubique]|nr:hypothetical protein [Candidatus Pelagibacter ubique]
MKTHKNIIFLTHAEKGPSGGAKIIYRHSEIIDKLKGYKSEVLHIKKTKISKLKNSLQKKFKISNNFITGWQFNEIKPAKNFSYKWLNHKVNCKNNFNFQKKKDFIIIPEIFAHLALELSNEGKIGYAIFVQNGFVLDSTNNEKKLKKNYESAKFILSYSNAITKCLNLKFPKIKDKIVKISYSLNLQKFNSNKKKNLITYMSRKLPYHSNLVINFLKSKIPKNWKIQDLNNLTEMETYKILGQSRIFMSFSNFEGLPLPPAEAALAGNFVIGYTGEGGNDYWYKPIFTKINQGDICEFVRHILIKIRYKNQNNELKNKIFEVLKKKFSKELEIKNIQKFLKLTH